jgi:hypothetical protein
MENPGLSRYRLGGMTLRDRLNPGRRHKAQRIPDLEGEGKGGDVLTERKTSVNTNRVPSVPASLRTAFRPSSGSETIRCSKSSIPIGNGRRRGGGTKIVWRISMPRSSGPKSARGIPPQREPRNASDGSVSEKSAALVVSIIGRKGSEVDFKKRVHEYFIASLPSQR